MADKSTLIANEKKKIGKNVSEGKKIAKKNKGE